MKISYKEFKEKINDILDNYDLEEIKLVINKMADNVNARDRYEFIESIKLKENLEYGKYDEELITLIDILFDDRYKFQNMIGWVVLFKIA